MRNSGTCPKCQGKKIVRVPGKIGEWGAGNVILAGMSLFSAVGVTRYICAACGFSEEWIDSAADTAKIKAKYAGEERPRDEQR
ncbi:MAG TPA: hypothetical protein VK446_02560 [Methylocystis sp.]|nr:hypothetical protein [Methylocystis sp.]